MLLLGLCLSRPETSYGYIKVGRSLGGTYEVERFMEKPDMETAKKYLRRDGYYWNSGMFSFTIEAIINAFKRFAPQIWKNIKNFEEVPSISIDYAIMERANKVTMLPLDVSWNDIGSWDAIWEYLEKDDRGNVKLGDVLFTETQGTLLISNNRLFSTVGIKNLLVVETEDAVLIAQRGKAQGIKEIVDQLKKENREEVIRHRTIYRPWVNIHYWKRAEIIR